MFPRLYCCYDVNDLFALRPFGVTCCRKFPSHFHYSTFEGGECDDECVVGVLMFLILAVAAVAATAQLNLNCTELVVMK